MTKKAKRPDLRILLKGIDAYEAHMRLSDALWTFQDVDYEEKDGKTSSIRRLHTFGNNADMKAVVTEDKEMKLGFIDFYGNDDEAIRDVVLQIDSYTEDELKNLTETAKTEDEINSVLLMLGVSGVTKSPEWKKNYIESHIRKGNNRQRMTALLAATLSANIYFIPAIESAYESEHGQVREYAKQLLKAFLTQEGS